MSSVLASLNLGTSSSATLQITCPQNTSFTIRFASSLRDYANAQGEGDLVSVSHALVKLEILSPVANATCAFAIAKACKTLEFKSFLRASSQTP